jgi:hypothetical protein
MYISHVSFLTTTTTITLFDMGTALSDAVYKILECAILTATCPESLNELSYLFCHMPTDLKNVLEILCKCTDLCSKPCVYDSVLIVLNKV